MTEPSPPPKGESVEQKDWIGLILALLVIAWIHLVTFAIHLIAWITQQFSIIESVEWPVWAWPLISLAQALLLLAPLLPLAWFWRRTRYRAVFQTLTISAMYILTMAPARLARYNQAQLAGVLQLAGSASFIAFLAVLSWWRQRRGENGYVRPNGPYLPVLLLAVPLSYPWLAWGAFGSLLDILLNTVSSLLFGIGAGLVVGQWLLPQVRRTGESVGRNLLLSGGVACTSLLLMSSALGFNGMQIVLMLVVPAVGWSAIALGRWGHEHIEEGWLAYAFLVGLVAAAPMNLVDPDELALVLNLDSRDVLTWSVYATAVTVILGWVSAVPLFLLRRRLPRSTGRAWLYGGIALFCVGAILLYVIVGQPGLYGEHLFVIFREQADLSAASGIDDPVQRRQVVYETLVSHANTTQQSARGLLDRMGFEYTPYYLVNAIEVDGGPLIRLWLSNRSDIDRVLPIPVLRPLPASIPTSTGAASAPSGLLWNLTTVGADRVWRELDARGAGVIVGQSDSGVQWDHPELQDAYRGRDGNHDYSWFDPWNHTRAPTDINGHGTHTLGTALGNTVGVAPDAEWYGCVNLARNLANPARYLDCMQFMLAPFPLDGDPFADADPSRGANVINNSWGCPDIEGCDPTSLQSGVSALRAAGVFVVASAGNEGARCGSVDSPIALYDAAFSIGAVDRDGRIASFSSRGPVTVDGSDRTKPDLVAPGVGILSAYPLGTYSFLDGTSMAGPHVVGVVALMWSANPELIGDVDRTEQILIETAQPYDYATHGLPACGAADTRPDNAVGYGLVDAYSAVQRAIEENNSP